MFVILILILRSLFHFYFSNDEVDGEHAGNVIDGNDGQIVENKCIFCGRLRKQINNVEQRISTSVEKQLKQIIKDNATKAKDERLLDFING